MCILTESMIVWDSHGDPVMSAWQRCWRFGLAPLLTPEGLAALRAALAADDPRLVQGATTEPLPIALFANAAVEGACAVGFCLWKGNGLDRVGSLHQAFRRICASADDLLDEPLGTVAFLNWFDETPRGDMRRELLAEIDREAAEQRRAA
jgi:hypothetical protein